MKNIRVTNFGQIKKADINFGNLTLFVGPQATGKSILLQLIKLSLDNKNIALQSYEKGYFWEGDIDRFQEFFFGEGMNNIWNDDTKIYLDEQKIYFEDLFFSDIYDVRDNYDEFPEEDRLFFIPAQRVMTLEHGWPRSFSSFEIGDPYVVRDFSEQLRLMMQQEFSGLDIRDSIFPNLIHLSNELYKEIDKTIFHGASVELRVAGMRKQFYIDINGSSLPFMAWSSGQREFMPFLLSFYWLTTTKKETEITWVVIEEPEMGLHPQAILSVILMCLELLNQGYKLIISTHSPVLLEAVWVIRFLQTENPDVKYLYQLFNLEPSPAMTALFENILKNKTFSTYYFDQQKDGVCVKDISTLDPGDLDSAIADWGGLTSFSSRASEVVSQAVQEKA
jgi:predicted ATPase